VSDTEGKEGLAWLKWLNGRFLPVYTETLAKMTTIAYSNLGLDKLKLLSASDCMAVATASSNAKYSDTTRKFSNGRMRMIGMVKFWDSKDSPWPGYTLNDNPASVKENFLALEQEMAKQKLNETKGKKEGSSAETKLEPLT